MTSGHHDGSHRVDSGCHRHAGCPRTPSGTASTTAHAARGSLPFASASGLCALRGPIAGSGRSGPGAGSSLIDGGQLLRGGVARDPGERTDLAAQHPDVVNVRLECRLANGSRHTGGSREPMRLARPRTCWSHQPRVVLGERGQLGVAGPATHGCAARHQSDPPPNVHCSCARGGKPTKGPDRPALRFPLLGSCY